MCRSSGACNVEGEARSRVDALQARIRPHFLYNSMNTIAALTRSDPARAEEAVLDLADLFRASLSEKRGLITLAEELECRAHLPAHRAAAPGRAPAACAGRWMTCRMRALMPALTRAAAAGKRHRPRHRESCRGRRGDRWKAASPMASLLLTVRNPLPPGQPADGAAAMASRWTTSASAWRCCSAHAPACPRGREGDEFVVQLRCPDH